MRVYCIIFPKAKRAHRANVNSGGWVGGWGGITQTMKMAKAPHKPPWQQRERGGMLGRVQRVSRDRPESQVAGILNSGSAISKQLDTRL